MTPAKLKSLVAEAVSLDRQRAEIALRLDDIKDQLVTEARSRDDEHTPTKAGGWSWVAEGADGCVARVTQDGPMLKASISTDKDVDRAKALAGQSEVFLMLFQPKVSYKLAAGFRDKAQRLLGKPAAKLIKSLTAPGRVKVSYETKEAA